MITVGNSGTTAGKRGFQRRTESSSGWEIVDYTNHIGILGWVPDRGTLKVTYSDNSWVEYRVKPAPKYFKWVGAPDLWQEIGNDIIPAAVVALLKEYDTVSCYLGKPGTAGQSHDVYKVER